MEREKIPYLEGKKSWRDPSSTSMFREEEKADPWKTPGVKRDLNLPHLSVGEMTPIKLAISYMAMGQHLGTISGPGPIKWYHDLVSHKIHGTGIFTHV